MPLKIKQEDLIEYNEIHNTVYKNMRTKIRVECKIHGIFEILPAEYKKAKK